MPVANTLHREIIALCQIKYSGSLWCVFQLIVHCSLPDRVLSMQERNAQVVWLPISVQEEFFLWKRLFCCCFVFLQQTLINFCFLLSTSYSFTQPCKRSKCLVPSTEFDFCFLCPSSLLGLSGAVIDTWLLQTTVRKVAFQSAHRWLHSGLWD